MDRTDFEQWKAKEVARLLALVESERRYYQEIIAALPVALVVLSQDRSILSANRAFRQTFGVRMEELRRKTIDQMLPSPQLIERIRDVHMHSAAPRDLFIELEERTLRVAIVPIRNWDEEGDAETLLMVEDLSAIGAPPARVPVQPAIPEIPAALWQADAATLAFTSVNGSAEQILGYPISHWLTTPSFFGDRIYPEDRSTTLDFYEAAVERGGDATAEYRAVSAAGPVIWCRETIRVTDPSSPKWVITGVLTDITRRKQLEEQLLTAERSSALQGMASRLAHDLNNPLMIITGYGEEMLHTLRPEDPLRGDVEQILTATERISGITGQLLGFTRRLANVPISAELNGLVTALQDKITGAAGESVKVEIAPSTDAVWASADPAQLQEVILALVAGVREDLHERSHLWISCRPGAITEHLPQATLPAGNYACLEIRDDGSQLKPERRAGLFEQVLGGKDSASPSLARAYSTVRAWGGDIAFSSSGTTITIYLAQGETIPPVPETYSTATHEPAPTPVEPPAEQFRETILLVEDEAGIRALVRKILRRERYNVLEAGNGEEALNIAHSHSGAIDLLLTDVMLPGIGGRDLAESLRQSLPDVKVLYVSGYTEDESVRAGKFPPGSRFLQKPFTLSSLVGKVREALDSVLPIQ